MDLQLHSFSSGTTAGNVEVADEVFATPYNEALIHQVVTAYFAGARRGTKAQKTRSDARGGGQKPWRQKGLGRARAGTIRSPLWRSGGATFAARPRDFSQKVNRKMYRAALRSIVSELVRQQRLIVIDNLDMAQPKTKDLAQALQRYDSTDLLVLVDQVSEALYLSSRNLHWVGIADVDVIDPAMLVSYAKVVITKTALDRLQERLK